MSESIAATYSSRLFGLVDGMLMILLPLPRGSSGAGFRRIKNQQMPLRTDRCDPGFAREFVLIGKSCRDNYASFGYRQHRFTGVVARHRSPRLTTKTVTAITGPRPANVRLTGRHSDETGPVGRVETRPVSGSP